MPRRRSLRALAALSAPALSALLGLASPRSASAFERQFHAGADAGYSVLMNPQGVALHGFGGGLHLTYGLSDTVNLLILADTSVHPATTSKRIPVEGVVLAGGSIGFGYVFDVLQWVPYVGATAGAYYAAGPSDEGIRLAVQIPFGLDYQLSRSFAVGLAGEYKLLLLGADGVSQRISAFLRAEYLWGY